MDIHMLLIISMVKKSEHFMKKATEDKPTII